MAAGTYDITIEQGASFSLTLAVKSAPTTEYPNGQPADLSDVVVRGQIRPSHDSPIVLAEFQGALSTPPEQGIVNLTLSALATKEIDALNYPDGVYDVLLLFPNGMVRRLIQGSVQISPGVTR